MARDADDRDAENIVYHMESDALRALLACSDAMPAFAVRSGAIAVQAVRSPKMVRFYWEFMTPNRVSITREQAITAILWQFLELGS